MNDDYCSCCNAEKMAVGEAEAFAGGFVAAAVLMGKGRMPALCGAHHDALVAFALKHNVEIVIKRTTKGADRG